MNRAKLKNLLKVLTPDATAPDFSNFDNEVTKLKSALTEKVQVKTLEDVNVALERNRKKINFDPLTQAFAQLKTDLADRDEKLVTELTAKQAQLAEAIKQSGELASQGDESLKQDIESLIAEVAVLSARKVEIPDFAKQIKDTEIKLLAVVETAKTMDALQDEKENETVQAQFASFEKQLKDLKLQFQHRGGGSMNRKITFGGTDYLTRYTDINYKAGSNVTFTIANNNTTKMVDVTVAATGGGGGTVRSINSVSVDTSAAAVAATDYVYLCSGTMILTLPDATASNTNLYTIKNVGSGIITIATTSAQTIDGTTTITMPTQYTSVDVISDTANWSIT